MNSAHPDFARVDAAPATDADLLKLLQASPGNPTKTLNGKLIDIDSTRGIARMRFEIVPSFCHTQGKVCQGGFLTGMVDTAMSMAGFAKGKLLVDVPTLEIKVSFLEAMGPGAVFAEGRVTRWGGSVGFLNGDLKDEKGRLIVHATSTIKIVRLKS
jgi:acyl-CoA thioesterase